MSAVRLSAGRVQRPAGPPAPACRAVRATASTGGRPRLQHLRQGLGALYAWAVPPSPCSALPLGKYITYKLRYVAGLATGGPAH